MTHLASTGMLCKTPCISSSKGSHRNGQPARCGATSNSCCLPNVYHLYVVAVASQQCLKESAVASEIGCLQEASATRPEYYLVHHCPSPRSLSSSPSVPCVQGEAADKGKRNVKGKYMDAMLGDLSGSESSSGEEQ